LEETKEGFLYQNLLIESSLYQSLHHLDSELALEVQKEGCECGGVLHRALYRRRPRGAPASTSREYQWRWSFCCAEEGCRRRCTPPSVLFLGRKVYFAAVVVLVSVLRQGPTPMKISKLEELVGVSAQTIARWRRWWLETIARSRFWAAARGHFRTPVDEKSLPLALLEAFDGDGEQEALVRLLCFLRPLTVSTARDY